MKIGILTLQLHDNYGGLLQAYALKTVLEKMGHQVSITNRRRKTTGIVFKSKQLIKTILGRDRKFRLSEEEEKTISQHTKHFTHTYIKDITEPIYTTRELKKIAKEYDAFVVGSDQVWRPRYSPSISNYFLDFVDSTELIGLSYAASFGVDTWEYTEEQTKICKENVRKFKAISVREESGIDLCQKHLGVKAIHVLDPTMLLDTTEYAKIISKEEEEQPVKGELLHYVLDTNREKEELIHKIAKHFNYRTFSVTRKSVPDKRPIPNINDCVYPKVTSWINGFREAKFVITDSFHGTAFSILFNKPFLVVPNSKRGRARFDSLLEVFGLQDRLILDLKDIDRDARTALPEIDWERVNRIIEEQRKFSLSFLKSNLN